MRSLVLAAMALASTLAWSASPLGLPPLPIPADNPQTAEKVALGQKLFEDKRFSSTGEVSCASCHDPNKGFSDGLRTSEGIRKLTGTRNAPTVINAAYFALQFWDGRAPTLEEQSKLPITNPIEMGLPNHDPVLRIVRSDPAYVAAFAGVFGKRGDQVTMTEVSQAIAAFERTIVSGDSAFDRYWFGGDKRALSPAAERGLNLFLAKGRCVSCHTVEQDHALFTDNRFHNVGVGISAVQNEVPRLARAFLGAKARGVDPDVAVLSDKKTSELGRFAITDQLDDIGSFKTSTLRNVAVTAPYFHDGSVATLREVVEHYNNGGVPKAGDPVNDYLSGGIRPLDLSEQEIDDLVAFLESLTSPQYLPKAAARVEPPATPGSPQALARALSLARAAQQNAEPINECATPGITARTQP